MAWLLLGMLIAIGALGVVMYATATSEVDWARFKVQRHLGSPTAARMTRCPKCGEENGPCDSPYCAVAAPEKTS